MGLALLRRERGWGERVYTTEILAELSQRAGTVQCESEALWKPGRAARLQRGCFSSLPLEPLLIVVLERLAVAEGEGGKIWENGIETYIISCMKREKKRTYQRQAFKKE